VPFLVVLYQVLSSRDTSPYPNRRKIAKISPLHSKKGQSSKMELGMKTGRTITTIPVMPQKIAKLEPEASLNTSTPT